MKNTFSLISLLFAGSLCAITAKNKVIENPAYEAKSTGIYNIEKIELTDTSTRIYVHNTFIPHWWVQFGKEDSIVDCKTGKVFRPIGIEGAKFDEKLWMPDSGDSTIVLIFPKLGETVEKIDFDNVIFGVSLTKSFVPKKDVAELPANVAKWIDSKLAKASAKPIPDFNSPLFFHADTGYLVGYLKGYDTRFGFSTGIIYANNALTREEYPIVMQIFPDGRFEAKLPLAFPVYSIFVINENLVPFYLEPGQTLAMVLDWEEFLLADRYRNIRYTIKNIKYKGPMAKINLELNGYIPDQFNYEEFQKKLTTLTPVEFKEGQKLAFQVNMKKAESYIANGKLSTQASAIIKNKVILENAQALFDFIMQRSYMSKQDSTNSILKQQAPADYYDFLKEMPLNDKSLLVNNEFNWFVNRFEYCEPFREVYKIYTTLYEEFANVKPEKDFLTYLKEEKVEVPQNDISLFSLEAKADKTKEELALFDSKKDSINDLHANKYHKYYNSYFEKYVMCINYGITCNRVQKEWRVRDSIISNVLGLKPNLVYEIIRTRSLGYNLQGLNREYASNLWDSLKIAVKEPFLIETGNRILNELYPEKKVASYELAPGIATDIFKKIIDPFKGKTLFVDFWATTCGPCVYGIKHMKSARDKYKDNPDFAFIFITDERSSPMDAYDNLVKEQELKNTFRISLDKYNYMRQLFKFNGIPRYVAIDKDGKVINDNFPMHNFENELSKILNKE
jgi:thiol-disulfide isomerase/thioredoxin